jgi:cellobiose phosphorylase
MYPWRTGTAGWMTMGLVEWILGARRHYDGLLIDPCLPSAIPAARVTRTFRDTVYKISITRTGSRKILLDGGAIPKNILPPPDRGVHEVTVTL